MRPSPVLSGRLKNRVRFTTKNVGKGFYRGTGTGALGAHTQYGNYLVDWRRVRHYVVPELNRTNDLKLTPFVSGKIYKDADFPRDMKGDPYDPKKIDGAQYVKWWLDQNVTETEMYRNSEASQQLLEEQEQEQEQEAAVFQQRNGTHST